MEPDHAHDELKRLLKKNEELLADNNRILHKMDRRASWKFWLTLLWYMLILGLPFLLYVYFLEPYLATIGADFSSFSESIEAISDWQNFSNFQQ